MKNASIPLAIWLGRGSSQSKEPKNAFFSENMYAIPIILTESVPVGLGKNKGIV